MSPHGHLSAGSLARAVHCAVSQAQRCALQTAAAVTGRQQQQQLVRIPRLTIETLLSNVGLRPSIWTESRFDRQRTPTEGSGLTFGARGMPFSNYLQSDRDLGSFRDPGR
jgi:hypothetical protein